MMTPHLTEILALLMVIGIAAQWIGWRLQIPAIILLSLSGLLIGPVLGIFRPSEALGDAYQPLINLAVAAILFEGGLSLHFAELRQAASGVNRLVTITVVLSLGLTAAAAHWVGGLSWAVALIFGAIMIVTGPTVILPLLRQARLKRRPASYLKWEGIVNDPIGALLVVVLFDYVAGAGAGPSPLDEAFLRMATGVAAALFLGGVGGWLLGRAFLAGKVPEYLKGPLALATAIGVYALSNMVLHEAGLIAATVLGIVLGNMNLPSIGEIRRFKEYVAILLVSGVFLLLTADLDPHIMAAMDWRSGALILVVIFIVRPLAVWISTIGAGMPWQERALLGWIAPRGVVAAAVAGVFGPALAERGFSGAEQLLPLVFTLILLTVVLHGFSLGWMARRLSLSAQRRGGLIIAGGTAWSNGLAKALHEREVPVILVDNAWHRLRGARLAGVPIYFGELLSEHAEYALELGAYGNLLAVSNNDAYNALVCAHFAPELGTQKVFQLASGDTSETRRPSPAARGRTAFSSEVQYEDLQRHWYQSWGFYGTRISESFDLKALRSTLPEGAIPLLVINSDNEATLIEADKTFKATPGQRVLWFGCKTACNSDKAATVPPLQTTEARDRTASNARWLPS
ncbi:MAG: sodium:proton antiporter [Lamprobacter sp.]|uniref:cation:proton antiporter n=1 Tax=Lamprobacter sp. TaxID=3100796 RepID=UPI002B25B06D|nr:sodium:proton antiporter [Lamprobacter sp.]MEA3639402.1 sodium:proton antiporter [Lamprobacter sp.]